MLRWEEGKIHFELDGLAWLILIEDLKEGYGKWVKEWFSGDLVLLRLDTEWFEGSKGEINNDLLRDIYY